MRNLDMNKIIEFLKNPRSKPILFFGFYLIFFLVLAISFRTAPTQTATRPTQTGARNYYNLGKIEDANYHFEYLYDINNILYTYSGERNGVRQLFSKTYNNIIENYYGYTNLFMKQENGIWSKSDNPYAFYEFLEVDNIKKMLNKATFISKTEFQNKSKTYTYQISTTTLDEIINNNIIDIDDVPNQIVITMDDNNSVEKIEYSLNSYAVYKNPYIQKLNITLSYSDFGNIKEIEEPKQ